jgi:L-iditol 2-dehydrogenase
MATDLIPERIGLAKKFGAAHAWRADDSRLDERIQRLTHGRGLDAVVVAVPADSAVRQALSIIRGGGRVLLFAHTKRGERGEIDLATVCVDEVDLLGSYSSDVTLQREVARVVFGRKLDVRALITHELPLEQTAEAVELAEHPSSGALKIVVRPGLISRGAGGAEGDPA